MLEDSELIATDLVANSAMNRGRGLSGVNSYERELRFDIMAFLKARAQNQQRVIWLDACCGEGRALNEAAQQFLQMLPGCSFQFYGVDLIDAFASPIDGVEYIAGDVIQITPPAPVDLVTCVHGMHYLGNKLAFLANSYATLKPNGIFLGHIDRHNVLIDSQTLESWRDIIKQPSLQQRSEVLRVGKSTETLDFKLRYIGATPSSKPHRSGIQVVDSWYAHER